jgi:hypothetical protein
MKTLRLFIIVSLATLVIATWAPAPVYAKAPAAASPSTTSLSIDAAKSKTVKLVVNNHTGGTLYVKLSGDNGYSFSASKQGKSIFSNIKPGTYTITVSTSACPGSLTYKRNMKGGTVTLKTFICRK